MGWFKELFSRSTIATVEEKTALNKSIAKLDVAVETLAIKVQGIQSDSEYNRLAFERLLDDALSVVKRAKS